MRHYLFIVIFLLLSIAILAQNNFPPELQSKYHMLSPDEMKMTNNNSKDFIATAAPTGGVRNIAEFEPNQGVIITYLGYFGIPFTLIAELSEDVIVYVICENSSESDDITSDFISEDVNMDNVEFVYAPIDSYWTRDYSPWFIEHGTNNELGIVNFPYNRPRPNDNDAPIVFGDYFNLDVFGMNLEHTGGNYMTNGMGISASCDLVYEENLSLSEEDVADLASDYLGADEYLLVQDPLDDYIEHIDCWGKFLDVDKMLVARVPASDYRYADFEAMADYWANQTSSYGNKFQVFRTDWEVDGNAYTNSLIMNNKVFVPFNTGSAGAYNAAAADAYEDAMPGYEIIGISYNNWHSTDALHCRTHEVPDMEMLRISHYPFLGDYAFQAQFEFEADVYTFNNIANISSVNLFYSVDGAAYQSVSMSLQSGNTYTVSISSFNEGETISYYIEGTDNTSKTETSPYIGQADPHVFSIESSSQSISNVQSSYLKAFPNPATEILYLVSNNLPDNDYSFEIYSQNGELAMSFIMHRRTAWNKKNIDISTLKSGIYYIRAISDIDTFTTKFVKL